MSDSDVMLNCGTHSCPSKCHQLSDHSKMRCERVIKSKCTRGHKLAVPCFRNNGACRFCTDEDEKKEKLRQRNLKLDIARADKQKEYERFLAGLQDEIEDVRRQKKDQYEENERQKVIDRHRAELEKLRTVCDATWDESIKDFIPSGIPSIPNQSDEKSSQGGNLPPSKANPVKKSGSVNKPKVASPAQKDWDYQKKFEGAHSDEIDTLMGMIGLENVKGTFLTIKAQVDIATKQGVDIANERFGTVLVGNPGTGRFASTIYQYRG